MGRNVSRAAGVLACLVIGLGLAACTPPKAATPAPTNLTLTGLSTATPRISLGRAVNYKLVPPAGATGSWVVERSGLTPGLSFNAATGVLSGTPTTAEIWYLRLHFQLTGGSSANVLPVYEIVGGTSKPIAPNPAPPGTFLAHSSPLAVHVMRGDAQKWLLRNDGVLVTEESATVPAISMPVSATEYDYQAFDFFPNLSGWNCGNLRMTLPSSLLDPAHNPTDPVTVAGADPDAGCVAHSSKNHRAVAVGEMRDAGTTLRVHSLGQDAATEAWATDLPLTSVPWGPWFVANDGSRMAFTGQAGHIHVVTAAGSTEIVPMDTNEGYCQLGGDGSGRAGNDATRVPLICMLNTGGRKVGHLDLNTGASELHDLQADLDNAWVDNQYQAGYDVFELRSWTPEGASAGVSKWLVNFETGAAEMVYQYTGPDDQYMDIQLFTKS